MGTHIHLFQNESAFEQAYKGNSYNEPWLSATHIQDSYRIDFNKDKKLLQTPITFEFIGDTSGTMSCDIDGVYYSLDNGTTWNSFDDTTLSVSPGTKVSVKGDIHDTTIACEGVFVMRNNGIKCNVYGNIMSIYDSTDFSGITAFEPGSTLERLFFNLSPIVSAEKLILPATALTYGCYKELFSSCDSLIATPELPATTLAYGCYEGMFSGCESLTIAPVLPATTLANACYEMMFFNCTSLTTAPELPATTLAEGCYWAMFDSCTGLTTVPELPATTLANNCYYGMFDGCTNLNYIKCLATNISASNCTNGWVNGVQTNSGTFIKNPSMSSWTTGVNGIPTNWTVQDNG